jgi:tripartite-type tricarboxylate transporter receptor subunit TctC
VHPERRLFPSITLAAIVVLAFLALSARPSVVSAQASGEAYPSRPVRLIVPYPPGGITDILARTIADRVSKGWEQQRMFVENRAGASGNIGVEIAARAPADGYTLLFGNSSTHAINPALFRKLPFDPIRDFDAVTLVASVSNVLLVDPNLPVKTLQDLIALAKSKPGALSFASNSTGSSNHLAGELLKRMAGIDMVHVPYKSATGAAVDVMGGRVAMMFDNLTTAVPHVKAGKLRALAVTGASRVAALPDVPTMVESGLKDFVVTPWWGIFVPAGTPKPVVARLNRDIVTVLHAPDVREFFAGQGTDVVGNSADEFTAYVKSEALRWGEVVRASGATVD